MKTQRNKMKTRIIIMLLPLTGCFTPASVFTLTPAETNIQWIDGTEFVNKNAQDISIQVGYVECSDNLLSFNVFIENTTDKPILIDPAKFEYVSHNHRPQDSSKADAKKLASFAVDPDLQIQRLNTQISDENENYRTGNFFDAIGGIFSLALQIGSIGEEKSEEQIQWEEQLAEDNERRSAERENDHKDRVESLENQKFVWQTQALRKTILLTDQTLEGNVYFKAHNEKGYLQLRFPIDSTNFEILFKLEEIRP
jgi:hypothetical protein